MTRSFTHLSVGCAVSLASSISLTPSATAQVVPCPLGRTFTTTADFVSGQLVNLNTNTGDRLEVNAQAQPLPIIWVPASARGTILKINTESGQILGEYWSAPQNMSKNPSRTTVDINGSLWAGNRDEGGGGKGSVVQIALVETGEGVDRNGNGVIDTSTGLGDIRPWPNAGGQDTNGGVSTAEDECIVKFVRVNGQFVRHLSVDGNNNIWTAGNFGVDNSFDLLDNATGAVLASFDVGVGGYGGLVDANGVLWSANRGPGPLTVLRYDTKGTVTTADDTYSTLNAPNAYGLARDSSGSVWNAQWTNNTIHRFAPDGTFLFSKPTGGSGSARGVTVTADDHIWVANSGGNDVSRLDNAGNLIKVVPLGADGNQPTGLSVDAAGKVWATCLGSSTAKRVDPNGGGDGLGAVDMTVNLGPNAGPYNYSDMTGQALISTNAIGVWSKEHDGGVVGGTWRYVVWNEEGCADPNEPEGTSIKVEVRAADTQVGLGSVPYTLVENGVELVGITGRFIQVRATLSGTAKPFQTPVLCDLSVLSGCTSLGDLNCDGEVNGSDIGILFAEWGGRGATGADLDGDGSVDGADLGSLLVNWGSCFGFGE